MSAHTQDYEPLLAKDEEDDHTRAMGEGRYPPSSSPPPSYPTSPLTLRAILNRPTLFFAFSCLLAFALSAVNMTVLSTSDSFSAYTMERQPKRFPTVYAGLEKVTWDTNRCRTRTTYPVEYATFEGDNVSGKKRVHAPRDEVVFSFGGKTSALVTFYIPDYALETCTLVFPVVYPTHAITSGYDSSAGVGGRAGPLRRDGGHSKKEPVMLTRPDYMNSTTSANINSQSVLEVSVLASPNTLRDRKRSSPISLRPVVGKDGNVTSASFACKSQSRVSLQITCPGDCQWEFGLQGMTIQSSSTKSLAKTGFHLQQYEGIECVK